MNHVTTALKPGQVDVSSQKRTYTVLEIQDILSISRPTAYALIRKNYFRSIRVENCVNYYWLGLAYIRYLRVYRKFEEIEQS